MAHPAPQRERCVQCSKIVYPQERLSIDSQVYHKMCLRCKTCATTLAIHNYVNVKGSIFCKRHVPLEGSGPKINVHAELQLSPRPTATADGQQAAPPPQPRASPRPNVLVPPLSPRSQAISTNYVNPRLSPRLPSTAHPVHYGAPAAHATPKLPATAHPTPAVFVHTSSNHKVAVPEAFTHSTPPATSNMSHSASSEEEDATTAPPAPAAEGTAPNGAVPRTESKERDRSRSDRTRKGSGKEGGKEKHGSGKERSRSDRSDGKSNTLGVSATTRTKKDKSTRLSGDKHDDAPEPSHPEKPSVGSAPLAAPTPAPASAPAPAAAAEAHHPPALAPLNIAAAVASQPVHTPAPPVAPSPRTVQPSPRGGHPPQPSPRGGHPVIPMAPHEAPHSHPPHLTSSYHPHAAPAPAVHVAAPAGHSVHPLPPAHSNTTPSLASAQTGSGKKKHADAAPPVISGPLTTEELLRMREGKERLPVPAAAGAPHGNTSPRLHEELHPKVGAEKATLLAFAKQPENQRCADCGATPAEWASANLGIFLCIACSGSHRALGTHISKVKSVMLDEWTQAEIDYMLANGNSKAAAVQYAVQLPPDVAMDKDTPQAQRNAVVRARYTNTAYVVPQEGDHKAQRKDTTKMVLAAGVLKINVIEGRNLPSKDLNGYSDPYVVIMQQGQRAGKTNKIKKTLNPKWNETVMVNLPSLAEKLTVQVWDWDRIGSHNFMGEAPLNLMMYNITPNSSVKFWLPVYAKEKQQGEVSLELTYFPIG